MKTAWKAGNRSILQPENNAVKTNQKKTPKTLNKKKRTVTLPLE